MCVCFFLCLSHGTCFSQQSFSPSVANSITLHPTTAPLEIQSGRLIGNLGTPELIPTPRIGTTFNPLLAAESLSSEPPVNSSVSRSTALLQGPSTSSLATIGAKGQDNLYHSTKF